VRIWAIYKRMFVLFLAPCAICTSNEHIQQGYLIASACVGVPGGCWNGRACGGWLCWSSSAVGSFLLLEQSRNLIHAQMEARISMERLGYIDDVPHIFERNLCLSLSRSSFCWLEFSKDPIPIDTRRRLMRWNERMIWSAEIRFWSLPRVMMWKWKGLNHSYWITLWSVRLKNVRY
jgi:hypothetical protein